MTDDTQPEALRLANVCSNLTRHSMDAHLIAAELRRQHARIAELEAQIAAVGAGGVQALSAAPVAFLKSVIALCSHRGYSPANIEVWDKDDKWIADLWRQAESMLTTSPTPPAEQAAPKAAPGDALDEALRERDDAEDFIDALLDEVLGRERPEWSSSRWAHDEKAALSATLLAMHGVLTSREAEIALLKKALLEAESAPQQEAQEPVAWLNPWRADQVTTDYDAYGKHGIPLVRQQPVAREPLSDDVVKDAARWRMAALIGNEVMLHPDKRTHATAVKAYMDATHSGSDLTGAVDAAIAAQGGKDA